jgi:hypothetical protein
LRAGRERLWRFPSAGRIPDAGAGSLQATYVLCWNSRASMTNPRSSAVATVRSYVPPAPLRGGAARAQGEGLGLRILWTPRRVAEREITEQEARDADKLHYSPSRTPSRRWRYRSLPDAGRPDSRSGNRGERRVRLSARPGN